MLAKPDYIVFGDNGRPEEMYCKVCGTVIAQLEYKPKGDVVVERFTRTPNYAELKMKMQDGSKHITNGCSVCVRRAMKDEKLMQAMYEADIPLAMPYETEPRTVAGFVTAAFHSRGMT